MIAIITRRSARRTALGSKPQAGARTALLALLLAGTAVPAAAATCTWNGGSNGNWNTTSWSCGHAPTGNDVAVINTGSTVSVTGGAAANLTVATGATLTVTGGLQVNGLTNNGTINFNGNGTITNNGAGGLTVAGSGTINLNTPNNVAFGTGTTTIAATQTIAGQGKLLNNGGVLSNAGTISANIADKTLTIDANGTSAGLAGLGFGTGNNAGLYNTGTIQTAGGLVTITDGLYENAATGTIAAANGNLTFSGGASGGAALVNLNGSGVLSKGIYVAGAASQLLLRGVGASSGITAIGTSGGGTDTTVRFTGNGTVVAGSSSATASTAVASSLTSIGQTGKLDLTAGATFTSNVATLLNNGIVAIGKDSIFNSSVDQTVGGSGQFQLSSSSAQAFTAGTTTIGSGLTILGEGKILGNGGVLNNAGTINSNVIAGAIFIDARGTSTGLAGTGVGTGNNAGLYNTGTITTSGGMLAVIDGLYENAATGTIAAGNGNLDFIYNSSGAALVNLNAGVLSKGIYRAAGSSKLTLRGNGSTAGITAIGTAGSGTDTTFTLSGNGTIAAGSSSAFGTTALAGSLDLDWRNRQARTPRRE